jgi:invasion protein IalB
MNTPKTSLALLLALGLSAQAQAQDSNAPVPPERVAPPVSPNLNPMQSAVEEGALSLGEAPPADPEGPGSTYIAATNGDWEVRCIRVEEGTDPCQMYQPLFTEEGESVAEIVMFNLPPGGEAVAAAEIITPLGTILTQQIAMAVDAGSPKIYPFRFCDPLGCVAQIGFTAPEVQAFRRGAKANMVIAHLSVEDPFNVPISLIGFSVSYDAVVASNTPE